jgi:hypothetical protein
MQDREDKILEFFGKTFEYAVVVAKVIAVKFAGIFESAKGSSNRDKCQYVKHKGGRSTCELPPSSILDVFQHPDWDYSFLQCQKDTARTQACTSSSRG